MSINRGYPADRRSRNTPLPRVTEALRYEIERREFGKPEADRRALAREQGK